MNNEQIVQIVVKGEQVLGLTSSGNLAVFDDNLNAFKIRGRAEVFNQNHEVCTVNPIIMAREAAIKAPGIGKIEDEKESIVTVLLVVSAIVALLVLIAFMIGY